MVGENQGCWGHCAGSGQENTILDITKYKIESIEFL